MNLGKVKTFLIVLFLGINIYLIISSFLTARFFIDSKTIDNTVELLKRNQISIDEDLIDNSFANLKNIDTNNIVYTKKFKEANKDGLFKTENDIFICEREFEGIYKLSDRKIKKEIEKFLEASGFETEHMKYGKISVNKKGEKTYKIRCLVKGYEIFDSSIKVTVLKDSFKIRGSWYEPLSEDIKSRSGSRDVKYVTSVLLSMLQNEDIMKNKPFAIKAVDYGYLSAASYGQGAHVTTSALPYYRIITSDGKVYYYDATNGAYLK